MIPISANFSTSANSAAASHSPSFPGPVGEEASNSRLSLSILYIISLLNTGGSQVAHLFILCNLYPDVSSILRLQDLDDIRRQSLIPTFTNCHSILRLTLDHTPVEFIFVPERGFLSQFTDPILLRLVVSCSMDIIFMFFEITEFLSMEELTSLFVVTFRERICLSINARLGWYYSLLFDVLTMMCMGCIDSTRHQRPSHSDFLLISINSFQFIPFPHTTGLLRLICSQKSSHWNSEPSTKPHITCTYCPHSLHPELHAHQPYSPTRRQYGRSTWAWSRPFVGLDRSNRSSWTYSDRSSCSVIWYPALSIHRSVFRPSRSALELHFTKSTDDLLWTYPVGTAYTEQLIEC
jgi:hypothetical protein